MELKERIVQEASTLFFKNGIRSVTMSDVANHLGISKRTLYEVFRDKEALLEACIIARKDQVNKEVDQIVKDSDNVIDTMMRIYAKHLNDAHDVNKSVLHDFKKYHPQLYKRMDDGQQAERINLLLPFFQQGVEQDLIRKDVNFEICFWLIRSQFKMLMEDHQVPVDKFGTNAIVSTIILNFIRGIATPKGNELIDEMVKEINNK